MSDLIKPIQAIIQQGTAKANISMGKNGFVVKFENSTPDFCKRIGDLVDSFVWSNCKKDEKTLLEMFKIDSFKKGV